MDQDILAKRFGRYLHLSDAERVALESMEGADRVVTRGTVLRAEHAIAHEIYVVRRGWLYSSMLLPDGNRQILSIHLPGDFAGDTALPWERAPFTLVAATDASVRVIEQSALRILFEQHPRLALLIHALSQVERVALADRLASVGRTSARARVAALIVDIQRRLRASGEDVADGVPMPLTQEEIGDATGLTAVHVNRMIRQLAEAGLIARGSGRMRVLDEAGLAAIAHHIDRHGAVDVGWLDRR